MQAKTRISPAAFNVELLRKVAHLRGFEPLASAFGGRRQGVYSRCVPVLCRFLARLGEFHMGGFVYA
ncbi:hypothetical protein SAMN06265373_108158 [Shimia sagamensis]|uniref:Uncharacterized protein n=1 Tax=Shimia sagamensis TaxID=1566352 RepID=A0ABY1PGR1_9RHOB|nr:hypothetical protein SAMN06265373_108158 [Shimia sagamensis]